MHTLMPILFVLALMTALPMTSEGSASRPETTANPSIHSSALPS